MKPNVRVPSIVIIPLIWQDINNAIYFFIIFMIPHPIKFNNFLLFFTVNVFISNRRNGWALPSSPCFSFNLNLECCVSGIFVFHHLLQLMQFLEFDHSFLIYHLIDFQCYNLDFLLIIFESLKCY